eukprot:8750428-Lingulodinium_polyedra.AAC.1
MGWLRRGAERAPGYNAILGKLSPKGRQTRVNDRAPNASCDNAGSRPWRATLSVTTRSTARPREPTRSPSTHV